MTGKERREQLLDIGRRLFAERGFEGTSIEEIAAKAGVSKPVVYEHFGGKEGLYAVVVDREVRSLLGPIKGEGGFLVDNERFGYRISIARIDEDLTSRVRLSIDPADRPLIAEAEGLLRTDRGSPRFEGVAGSTAVTLTANRQAAAKEQRVIVICLGMTIQCLRPTPVPMERQRKSRYGGGPLWLRALLGTSAADCPSPRLFLLPWHL